MPAYLQSDTIARAQALGLKARSIVEGIRVGDHKSPFRGFSVEFVQHREYVPGDDIRHIDWKSYGRSERYSIKQYEQETNFIGHVLLDASRSMEYGEGETNKLEYGKLLAATLTYLIVHQRDSVGVSIFDANWRTRLPVSGQPGHVHTVLEALTDTEPRDTTTIGPLLDDLARQIGRRKLVFVISDCFDDVDAIMEGVRHLRFQKHEVTIFHILHPDELDFPFDGMVKFDALEEKMQLLTRPQLIRPAYQKALQKYLDEIQQKSDANQCDYLRVNTGVPLSQTLTSYLARRLRRSV